MSVRYCETCGRYDCAEFLCGDKDNGTCCHPDCACFYRNARAGCHVCKPKSEFLEFGLWYINLSPEVRVAVDKAVKELCKDFDRRILETAVTFARDPKDFI